MDIINHPKNVYHKFSLGTHSIINTPQNESTEREIYKHTALHLTTDFLYDSQFKKNNSHINIHNYKRIFSKTRNERLIYGSDILNKVLDQLHKKHHTKSNSLKHKQHTQLTIPKQLKPLTRFNSCNQIFNTTNKTEYTVKRSFRSISNSSRTQRCYERVMYSPKCLKGTLSGIIKKIDKEKKNIKIVPGLKALNAKKLKFDGLGDVKDKFDMVVNARKEVYSERKKNNIIKYRKSMYKYPAINLFIYGNKNNCDVVEKTNVKLRNIAEERETIMQLKELQEQQRIMNNNNTNQYIYY